MTRPRRSKRSKSAQSPQELSSNSRNQIAEAPVHEARPLNTKGLPILPDELLLEIISYYPVTPIPDCDPDVEDQNIRRQVLFALSQTSSNLRRFFLCSLWQRIEVCRTRTHAAPMKNRSLALELVRQLEIVTIRDPTLAEYVQYVSHLSKLKFNQFLYIRVVNVEIGGYAQTSVLAELARCLALFPNMHTVQLKIEETDIRVPQTMIAKPFEGYVYHSVQTVVVSRNILDFLKCCPQARRVDSYESYVSRNFWDAVAASCPRLEVSPCKHGFPRSNLSGIFYEMNSSRSYGHEPTEIATIFPALRDLTLEPSHFFHWGERNVNEHVISELLKLKQLQKLTIFCASQDSPSHKIAQKLLLDLQCIDKQDKVLVLQTPGHDSEKKTFVLRYRKS